MADTSRCLPTRNSSESAALLSILVLEEQNLCCCVYLHMYMVVFFSYKDFLLYMSSPKRNLAVSGEVPSVFVH